MFEKEAKKWVSENTHTEHSASFGEIKVEPSAKKGFQKGAEFGYNKAKEDSDKMKSQFLELCNLKDMRIAELEKANEWHYVKDGDLPPLDTNVLVIHRWAKTPEVGKRIKVFINSSVWVWAMCSDRFRYTSDDENIYAWKEIVLPKESE